MDIATVRARLRRRPSPVEDHPEFPEIVRALADGLSTYQVSERWKISQSTVSRYRAKRLDPAILEAIRRKNRGQINPAKPTTSELIAPEAEGAIAAGMERATRRDLPGDMVLDRMTSKLSRYGKWFSGAEKARDFKSLAALDGAESRAIELFARLTGRLDSSSSTTTTNITVIMPSGIKRENPVIIDAKLQD